MMLQSKSQMLGLRRGCTFRPCVAPTRTLVTVRHVPRAAEPSVAPSEPTGEPSEPPAAPVLKKRLWVGNIPNNSRIKEVRELFNSYGAGTVIYLRNKETKRFRGMAFVEVDPDKAEQAIAEMNEKEFKGRALRVNLSNLPDDVVLTKPRPRTQRPRRKAASGGQTQEGAAPAEAAEPAAAAAEAAPAAAQ